MSRYAGKVKVVGVDKLCFPAEPGTLEPLGCGCYDPFPWLPSQGAVEVIDVCEWNGRRADMRDAEIRRSMMREVL